MASLLLLSENTMEIVGSFDLMVQRLLRCEFDRCFCLSSFL